MKRLAIVLLLSGCTRTPAPTPSEPVHDASGALDGCTSETKDGATTWSCGSAFLALDADVAAPATPDAIELNFKDFEEQFGKDVTARDAKDYELRGKKHRALRLRVSMAEKGRFVATMVMVDKGTHTRVISCSAREIEATRCDDVLTLLVGRAME